MYYVYILKLSDNSYYVGSTSDLKKRFSEHQHGYCLITKDNRPINVHWFCAFSTKNPAIKFEKYLKGGSGTAFRHRHIK